jgi:transposase, IS6 family
MSQQSPFKWRHFEADIILLCVRWYLRYSLSYCDLEEMMRERGLHVDRTTIYRWVQRYAPELDKRCLPHLKACNDSWKVDETYVKVRKIWIYLYRAVDSEGNTLELKAWSCGKSNISTIWWSRTIASSIAWSSQGWASFPWKRQSERCRDMRSCTCFARDRSEG